MGNWAMAFIIAAVGFTPTFMIVKPPKSTSFFPKANLLGLKMMLLVAQCEMYYKVCQEDVSTDVSHKMVSSMILVLCSMSTVISSNFLVYASPDT